MITSTFTIYPDRLGVVADRLAKLNKKAVKLGIEPATLQFVETVVKSTVVDKLTGKTREVVTPALDVTVSGNEIKYGNYTHVASLDHTVGEMPIVNVVPNETVPAIYQTAKAHCEHCNSTRSRKNTFIFRDGDQYKQVGSTCLKEFFGIDPTQKLNWFADLSGLEAEFYGAGTPEFVETNRELLSIALAVVEQSGYVSAKQATDEICSTATATKSVLYPPARMDMAYMNYIYSIRGRAEQLLPNADAMIEWATEKFANESSDYAHNISIFLKAGYTKLKYYGYTISIIAAWNKHLVEQALASTTKSENAYVGNVGDKVVVDVVVNKIIEVDGNYGTSYINIMTQKETGNSLVWFSSNNILSEGNVVQLKGTIKALNNRDGVNQTALTRCKVI